MIIRSLTALAIVGYLAFGIVVARAQNPTTTDPDAGKSAQASPAATNTDPAYKIGPQDVLRIDV